MTATKKAKMIDFVSDKKAYMVTNNRSRDTNEDANVIPVEVLSMERKYVVVKHGDYRYKFKRTEPKNAYLTDQFGKWLLFNKEKQASEFAEKQRLKNWIVNQFVHKRKQYTLSQLRRMKKIMEEDTRKMNVAISRISDEKFTAGQVLEVLNIDNALVTVKDQKGNNYVIDFEDGDFTFIFNISKEELLKSSDNLIF